MKYFLKFLVVQCMRLWAHVYTYRCSQWLTGKRGWLYTMWMRQFLGLLGEHSAIGLDCQLQGGGSRNIYIGDHTHIGRYAVLGCWTEYRGHKYSPSIHIGNHCNIGEWNHITAINKITIGDGLLTGRFVYIGDNAHGGLSWEEADTPPAQRPLQSKGEVVIGRNVWLGDKVVVLSGVRIGDNVIVGANAVVTHDLPSNCLAAGMPARIVKRLERENDKGK